MSGASSERREERLRMTPKSDVTAEGMPSPQNNDTLFDLIMGFRISRMIYVAAALGIADLLNDGPQPVDILAKATGTHAPSLYRLLRALAGLGIFAEDEQGRFTLTPRADLLRSGVPGSQ